MRQQTRSEYGMNETLNHFKIAWTSTRKRVQILNCFDLIAGGHHRIFWNCLTIRLILNWLFSSFISHIEQWISTFTEEKWNSVCFVWRKNAQCKLQHCNDPMRWKTWYKSAQAPLHSVTECWALDRDTILEFSSIFSNRIWWFESEFQNVVAFHFNNNIFFGGILGRSNISQYCERPK